MKRIGLISDTHGLLRPEARAFLEGSDHIIHAGDIVGVPILAQLFKMAPLTAVRGNNDRGPWTQALRETEVVEIDGTLIYVLHDLAMLDVDPQAAGFRVVVSGHSHRPLVEERGGVLYVNPGSAGPRRFRLPITVAELHIAGDAIDARIIELEV